MWARPHLAARARRCCHGAVDHTDVTRQVEAVWRIESARLIATLTRMVGDVGSAEEFA